MSESRAGRTGKVVRVVGPAIDVEFGEGDLPPIYQALHIKDSETGTEDVDVIVEGPDGWETVEFELDFVGLTPKIEIGLERDDDSDQEKEEAEDIDDADEGGDDMVLDRLYEGERVDRNNSHF